MKTRRQLLAEFVVGSAAVHLLPRLPGAVRPPAASGELEWRPFWIQDRIRIVNGTGAVELHPATSYLLAGVGIQF